MSKLAPVSRRRFIQRLRELDFDGPIAGGKHAQMRRGNVTLIIPNEHEGEIGPGFLSRLLRQAGVTRDEWLGGG
ncbi:MAG: type II toxin-antitoxin system HicA family toxin [Planctomycetes bacterium]|nr:type II toxin-antitoxin system HicA family toxin [Verrucomicrobiota bacterium]MBM4025841.1 type II toxin-antitoxin system HicA family toxin [Planctomycetota bacterium]